MILHWYSFVDFLQVALGKPRDLLAADYEADQLPEGINSVKGLGKTAPDPNEQHIL